MDYVRLWLDHSRLGCGWRGFVLVRTGRKWAHLVEPTRGVRVKVPRAELRHASTAGLPPRWRRIAAQLRRAAGDDRGLLQLAADCRRVRQ